ncbi:MAG: hypothetical protein K0Q57_1139, partial [Gammaproteobacteria bacterium]|nr:hypothetical protein [Gammaproteobacteria bacterium]
LVLTVIIYAGLYFIASVMILKSINFGNATLAALVESSYPLFTLVFSYVFLKQIQFNGGILVGCGFLVAGLILIQLYSSELLK